MSDLSVFLPRPEPFPRPRPPPCFFSWLAPFPRPLPPLRREEPRPEEPEDFSEDELFRDEPFFSSFLEASCESLADFAAGFFAPERRLGRLLRRLFSPEGLPRSCSVRSSRVPSEDLSVVSEAPCFFRLEGERRRVEGESPSLPAASLLRRGRRRRLGGLPSAATFFSPSPPRAFSLDLPPRPSPSRDDFAGRLRLRDFFRAGCSPPSRLPSFAREVRVLPLSPSVDEPAESRDPLGRDRLPLERLRTGLRSEPPSDRGSAGFLLREPEEPPRLFDDLSSPELRPAPNSWPPDSGRFPSVFFRTAKMVSYR